MLKIGLTGGIGSGKTTVSNLFSALNPTGDLLAIIDTDIIAREIVETDQPAYTAIVDRFGNAILNDDLSINRKELRNIVFNNNEAKKTLESITHPYIHASVEKNISELNVKYCIIVIPLLFESQSNYHLDRILVIDSSEKDQITRSAKRDNNTAGEIKRIIQSQVTRKYRLEHANDIINNNGSQEQLISQVEKLHQFYLDLK